MWRSRSYSGCQLLNGEKYVRRSAEFLTTTSTVSAARGEILDRYGRPLVTNNTGFSLVLIYSSFWDGNDKRFDTLLDSDAPYPDRSRGRDRKAECRKDGCCHRYLE